MQQGSLSRASDDYLRDLVDVPELRERIAIAFLQLLGCRVRDTQLTDAFRERLRHFLAPSALDMLSPQCWSATRAMVADSAVAQLAAGWEPRAQFFLRIARRKFEERTRNQLSQGPEKPTAGDVSDAVWNRFAEAFLERSETTKSVAKKLVQRIVSRRRVVSRGRTKKELEQLYDHVRRNRLGTGLEAQPRVASGAPVGLALVTSLDLDLRRPATLTCVELLGPALHEEQLSDTARNRLGRLLAPVAVAELSRDWNRARDLFAEIALEELAAGWRPWAEFLLKITAERFEEWTRPFLGKYSRNPKFSADDVAQECWLHFRESFLERSPEQAEVLVSTHRTMQVLKAFHGKICYNRVKRRLKEMAKDRKRSASLQDVARSGYSAGEDEQGSGYDPPTRGPVAARVVRAEESARKRVSRAHADCLRRLQKLDADAFFVLMAGDFRDLPERAIAKTLACSRHHVNKLRETAKLQMKDCFNEKIREKILMEEDIEDYIPCP
jgi:hypothetical protein